MTEKPDSIQISRVENGYMVMPWTFPNFNGVSTGAKQPIHVYETMTALQADLPNLILTPASNETERDNCS